MNHIYLDASATTPPHIDVINHINNIQLEFWGNPSSIHEIGINASNILERSKLLIANKLKSKTNEIFFTSGATDSNNLALKCICNRIDKGRLVISCVEHPSINKIANKLKLEGWDIKYWPVDNCGNLNLDLINEMLSPPTKVVSIIWGQSEIGTVQPINAIGKACRDRNIFFHTDATQVLPHGLIDWNNLNVDILSASAHKLQGPKGIGLLMFKKDVQSILMSKSMDLLEGFISPGTAAVPLIAGFASAINLIEEYIEVTDYKSIFPLNKVSKLTTILKENLIRNKQLTFIGSHINRLPNNLAFLCHTESMHPINGREVVRELSRRKVLISSGSACSSLNLGPNPILTAINVDKPLRESSIRITIGPWINIDDINNATNIINEALFYLQSKLK